MIHFLAMLAVWRLASLFTYERGPLALFERIRKWSGIEDGVATTEIGKGLNCFWCNSLWWSAGICGWLVVFGELSRGGIAVAWLGYSAGAILLEEVRSWLEEMLTLK